MKNDGKHGFNLIKIYYHSGTGNTYRVAKWIKKNSLQKGKQACISPIDTQKLKPTIQEGDNSLLCILFPTHGFCAPWIVIKFTLSLPFGKATKATCIATQASLKFGKVYIPGLSGSATFLIALILFIKGYKVIGVNSFNMPSNWISLHSGLNPKNVNAIIKRTNSKVNHFSEKLISGKTNWFTWTNFYEFLLGLPLVPISFGYMFFGRFFLGKIFFANNKCNSCNICANNCPNGAIKMKGKSKPRPFWTYKCESCMRCMAYCPQRAIEVNHPWAIYLGWLTMFPVSTGLFRLICKFLPESIKTISFWKLDIFNLIYYFCVIFISYYILFALTKIPFINKIFTYSTLTYIYRRYHEPNTKIKDLINVDKSSEI